MLLGDAGLGTKLQTGVRCGSVPSLPRRMPPPETSGGHSSAQIKHLVAPTARFSNDFSDGRATLVE